MIRKLQLKNFKCFEDAPIPLENLTLLTGLNGMGKSSAIQALLVLRQSFQQGLLIPGKEFALNGDLINLGTAKSVLYEDALEDQITISLEGDQPENRFEVILDYNKNSDVMQSRYAGTPPHKFHESLFTDDFQYLHAERLGPRVTFPVSENLVGTHRQLGSQGEFTSHFLEIFGKKLKVISAIKHENEQADELMHQTAAWLGEISPGVSVHLNKHTNMDVVNLEYSYTTSKGRSNAYRASSVGFGITYTLPIIVAILAAKPGGMLILENPEAHLHPKGQVRIGELIAMAANAGIQLIVETHSDHILNGIRVAVRQKKCAPEKVAIHYFSRSGGYFASKRIASNGNQEVSTKMHWSVLHHQRVKLQKASMLRRGRLSVQMGLKEFSATM